MKKTLLFFALLLATSTNFAQENEATEPFTRTQSSAQKIVYGGWYNFGQMIYDNIGNVNYYRNHLFPDSSVLLSYTNGYGSVWKHSLGQVFDPTGDSWAIGSIYPTEQTDAYTVDSVRIWYRYFRHQNANPDTLIVQVYTQDDMSLYADPWTTGQSYASTAYDYTTHKGVNPTQTITILLDDSDTSMSFQNALELEINQFVNAGEVMGITATYFPGNPHNFGDTIDQYIAVPPVNRLNAFIMYNFNDNNDQFDNDGYNHSWLIPSSIRYNENTQNWNGWYYPGIAYFNYVDHTDIDFHVVGTVGIEEMEATQFSLYPNPSATSVFLRMNSKGAYRIVSIVDITGKDVTSLTKVAEDAINIASLSDGQYLISIETNGVSATQRFVVQH